MIALGIIDGLTEVHGAKPSPGMGNLIPLHRNLTPENVLLTPKGKIVLCDIDMGLIGSFAKERALSCPLRPFVSRPRSGCCAIMPIAAAISFLSVWS